MPRNDTTGTRSKSNTSVSNTWEREDGKVHLLPAAFSPRELEDFRKIILRMRQEALDEILSLRQSIMAGLSKSQSAQPREALTDSALNEETAYLLQRQTKFFEYLERALQRIDNGTFGWCMKCGKLIEKGRLEAVPHTQHCVQCKSVGRHAA